LAEEEVAAAVAVQSGFYWQLQLASTGAPDTVSSENRAAKNLDEVSKKMDMNNRKGGSFL